MPVSTRLISSHSHQPTEDRSAVGTLSPETCLLSWSLQELSEGTDNFAEHRRIGEGGFGHVYHALMRHTHYAVKRLKEDSDLDWKTVKQSFHTELQKLYHYRHPNIVELAGCCVEGDIYCLVYVYMANGSLEDRLQCQNNTPALPWLRRLDIALGAARAIQFLHSSNPSLIHGDVKSSNILLDENLSAKLGDFGLARFSRLSGNTGRSCTVARTQTLQGTLAYLPNEYIQSGQLAPELDTYSFGVVLLEILTGRKALENHGPTKCKYLKEMVEEDDGETSGTDSQSFAANLCLRHLDRKPGQCVSEVLLQLCVLACECLNRRRRRRPKMTTVYTRLEELRQRLAGWPEAEQPSAWTPGHEAERSRAVDKMAEWSQPVDRVTESLRSCSLSPVQNTYRFPSVPQGLSKPTSSSSSLREPPSWSPSTDSLSHSGKQPWPVASVSPSASWGASRPVESDESDAGGGIYSQTSLDTRLTASNQPRPSPREGSPRHSPSPSPVTTPADTRSPQDSGSCCGAAQAGDGHGISPLIVLNPAKQRILEQFALYRAGQIDSTELLSSFPDTDGSCSVERRGPEESDEFD
ncbi:interleukin-1 receptor-associated kinase 1 isoform X2 [Callorhinchus milii]|uniref:interleukin-1 receptor-associated kinase 1 isoform X2 n=1 Tax=Callorhinchus milii TaxID=7868 RepID=UPI001C3F64E7|nr:interleukin-1 receptor-associated kinase 1 isoform X2 [Callorhinchus milii]